MTYWIVISTLLLSNCVALMANTNWLTLYLDIRKLTHEHLLQTFHKSPKLSKHLKVAFIYWMGHNIHNQPYGRPHIDVLRNHSPGPSATMVEYHHLHLRRSGSLWGDWEKIAIALILQANPGPNWRQTKYQSGVCFIVAEKWCLPISDRRTEAIDRLIGRWDRCETGPTRLFRSNFPSKYTCICKTTLEP